MNDVICFRNDILVHKEQDVVWPQCQWNNQLVYRLWVRCRWFALARLIISYYLILAIGQHCHNWFSRANMLTDYREEGSWSSYRRRDWCCAELPFYGESTSYNAGSQSINLHDGTLIDGTFGRLIVLKRHALAMHGKWNSYTTRECTQILLQFRGIDWRHEIVLFKTCSASWLPLPQHKSMTVRLIAPFNPWGSPGRGSLLHSAVGKDILHPICDSISAKTADIGVT